MNILFHDWRIGTDRTDPPRQFDHLTRDLVVTGVPEGWSWDLLVRSGGSLNIITLSPREGGVGVTLTAGMLALSGSCGMQLRGTRGEAVRHTNIIQVFIPESMSGDVQWPVLPSEFSQAEAVIRELNEHPPMPGTDGFWLLWDTQTKAYEQSDIPVSGSYELGNGLKLTGENTLEVDTADAPEQDNTLPITSAAVYSTVGNIGTLLTTI